jgi:hypothetical protein
MAEDAEVRPATGPTAPCRPACLAAATDRSFRRGFNGHISIKIAEQNGGYMRGWRRLVDRIV